MRGLDIECLTVSTEQRTRKNEIMNLSEIAAKVTGLETKINALESAKETAETQSADIQAKLDTATDQLSAITAERDTLASEKVELISQRDAAQAEVAELKEKAMTVKEAASRQAVEIVAGQGAEAAKDAAEVEGSTGESGEPIAAQYAKLHGAERVEFFRKHRSELIKSR